MSFGIGTACLAAAACLLLPTFYVTPQVGYAFVLVAFTIVVLGGMGSFAGALVGGLLLGVVEALGGLFLGESLGQIGIFVIFILVLLFRPTGLFGARRMTRRGSPGRRVLAAALLALCRSSSARSSGSASGSDRCCSRLLGQAWNVLGGYGGQFSFGHALFFGTGAYATAVLQVRHRRQCLGRPAARASPSARCVGGLIGALVFRYGLRGSYFALVTLAFAEVVPHPRASFEYHRRRRSAC